MCVHPVWCVCVCVCVCVCTHHTYLYNFGCSGIGGNSRSTVVAHATVYWLSSTMTADGRARFLLKVLLIDNCCAALISKDELFGAILTCLGKLPFRFAAVDGKVAVPSILRGWGSGGAETCEGVNGGVSTSGLATGLGELECKERRAMSIAARSLREATVTVALLDIAHVGGEPVREGEGPDCMNLTPSL